MAASSGVDKKAYLRPHFAVTASEPMPAAAVARNRRLRMSNSRLFRVIDSRDVVYLQYLPTLFGQLPANRSSLKHRGSSRVMVNLITLWPLRRHPSWGMSLKQSLAALARLFGLEGRQ